MRIGGQDEHILLSRFWEDQGNEAHSGRQIQDVEEKKTEKKGVGLVLRAKK